MASKQNKIGSAIGWNVASGLMTMVLQFGATMIMARLLTPDDYGAYAFGYAISVLVMHLTQRGLSTAILLKIADSDDAISVAFSASLLIGFISILVMTVMAILLGWMGTPLIRTQVLAFMAIPLFVQIVASPVQAILQYELRYREISLANLFGFIVGNGLVAVFTAWMGFGPWSLALGSALTTIVGIVPLVYATRRHFGLSRNLPRVFRTMWQMVVMNGLRGLDVAWVQAPIVIGGLHFSDGIVGLYQRMQFLADLSMQLTVWRVSGVFYASLASGEKSPDVLVQRSSFVFGVLCLLALPIATFVLFAANSIVLTLLGPKWLAGSGALQVLGFAFGVSTLNHAPGMVLEISGCIGTRYILSGATLLANVVLLSFLPAGASFALMALPALVSMLAASVLAWVLVKGGRKHWSRLIRHSRSGVALSLATAIGAIGGEALFNAFQLQGAVLLLFAQGASAVALSLMVGIGIINFAEMRIVVDALVKSFPQLGFLRSFMASEGVPRHV